MKKYFISIADLEKDKKDIISLWNRCLPAGTEGRYSWIYTGNPCGSAVCLVARNGKVKSLAGAVGLFPRMISLRGTLLKAGIVGDFAVDEEHRAFGPALSLQKSVVSCCDGAKFDLILGFPNEKAEMVLLRAGFQVLGNLTRLTKPLRSQYFIKRYLDVPFITRGLSGSIDFILESKYLGRSSGRFVFEKLSEFDSRIDTLWKKAAGQHPIMGVRNRAYLTWRYLRAPHNRHQIVAMIPAQSSEMVGYIVYQVRERSARIVDFLTLGEKEDAKALLAGFVDFQRKEGMQAVSLWHVGGEELEEVLQEVGFFFRENKEKVLIFIPPGSSFRAVLAKKENWYLLPGDNDA